VTRRPATLSKPIASSRIVVYIDPLDGTNEYAAGEREAVTVLLGVAVDGVPAAGVIHQPFFGYSEETSAEELGRTVWGGPGAGVRGNIHVGEAPPVPPIKACLQRNLRDERQEPCIAALGAEAVCNISATGYHFLRILQGDAHCNLMLRKASKKWDSCAGEALLLAVGGGLTDTVGRRYK